ncbi:MAG TPA: hypothetical protein DCZ94_08905 [Lentisphaeria bacterium]|nr:MAG: hypothetical protein A2X48_23495 [Lentisphaerae bacterium GWF2_49_21]HBC87059.1 hypothetical protein [Lentisphaeria bacterium]
MKSSSLIFLCIIIALLAGCATYEESPARRYLDVPEYKLSLKRLLYPFAQQEVGALLQLTGAQKQALQKVFTTMPEAMPGYAELARERHDTIFAPGGMTSEANLAYRKQWQLRKGRLVYSFYENGINSVLTQEQKDVLRRIELQTRGPLLVNYDERLAAQLEISDNQKISIKTVVDDWDRRLYVPRKRVGGLIFLKERVTDEESIKLEKEQIALLVKIKGMLIERDQAVAACLSSAQLKRLKDLEGPQVRIGWRGVADTQFVMSDELYRWNPNNPGTDFEFREPMAAP